MSPYQHNGSDKCPACSWHACVFRDYITKMQTAAETKKRRS